MASNELGNASKLDGDHCPLSELVVALSKEGTDTRLFTTATPTVTRWD